jgi:hypothetical protein
MLKNILNFVRMFITVLLDHTKKIIINSCLE